VLADPALAIKIREEFERSRKAVAAEAEAE